MKNIRLLSSIGLCLFIGCSSIITNSIFIPPVVAQNNTVGKIDPDKISLEGNKFLNHGDYQAALAKYQQALVIYRETKSRWNEGETLGNICSVNYYLGQINTALEFCQQSLAIAREVNNKLSIGFGLNTIGLIYQNNGKYELAIESYQQALTIFRESKNSNEGTILYNLAFVYHLQGNYPQALKLYQQSIELSKLNKDRSSEGRAYTGIGLIYQIRGDYTQALKIFFQARAIEAEIDDKIGLGAALMNIGQTYVYLADYPQALKYFADSSSIFRSIGYLSGVGVTLNNQGNVYYLMGKYPQALVAFQGALKIYREISNPSEEGAALSNIGGIYSVLGQYQRALKYYQSALEIAKNLGNKSNEGVLLSNVGWGYYQLGQYNEAKDYHQQAITVDRATGNREAESTALNNLAQDYHALKQYPESLKIHIQSLTIKQSIGDRAGEAYVLNNIGQDYSSVNEIEKSLIYYRQATAIAHSIKYLETEGVALNNQGIALYRLDRLPEAEAQLRAAISIWESLRVGLVDRDKISLQDRIKGTYDLLQKVLIEQNKFQAALEIAERGRARVLAELLASKISTINSATSQKIRQAPNLSKIQQIARAQKATLVEYSTIGDRILIWVIKPTGKITFHQTKLPPKTTLKDLVDTTRDGIGANRGARSKDDTPNPTGGDLKQLHQLLIAPIVKDLPTKPEERVIILPQNELFLVPFAALQDDQDRYLIQQHTITIAPSIQVLALSEAKTNRLSKVAPLVVGNPIMPSFDPPLRPLPGSEGEAKGIGTILQVAPLIGAQADKQKVIALMKTAPIIHLATHGLLDTIKGDIPGAIALTNGFLTSGEIFDMQLSANLVVLSACDTGRGDLTGEGVVGISRSFSVAGVPSVIVSLWEVNDEATKALMEEFYRNLQLKKLPKAQALRQAMLTTMVDHPNPNFWSAFMLVGEGR